VVIKKFRAEVRLEGKQWTLLVPDLANLSEHGKSLIEAEQRMRRTIAGKFHIGQDDVSLELEDRRAIARERARRPVLADLSHPAIRT
jgi:predicted RNase H-like HicB family nuclease